MSIIELSLEVTSTVVLIELVALLDSDGQPLNIDRVSDVLNETRYYQFIS